MERKNSCKQLIKRDDKKQVMRPPSGRIKIQLDPNYKREIPEETKIDIKNESLIQFERSRQSIKSLQEDPSRQ